MTVESIDRIIRRIRAEVPEQAQRAGYDMAALIKNRVVQTGQSAAGQAFSPYSDKPAPAWFYLGRSRTGAGEAQVKEKVRKREGISYKEFRELNGLRTDKKNFEFNGFMWRGVTVKAEKNGAVSVAVITGDSQEVNDLLRYASAAERISILKPSLSEIITIEQNLGKWFVNLINEEK